MKPNHADLWGGLARGLVVCLLLGLCAGPGWGIHDPNTNGVSDVWEARYGLQNPQAGADADGDGQSDLQEAQNGTDPGDAQSLLALTVGTPQLGKPLLTWESVAGKRYRVEGLDPEGVWQLQGEGIVGSGDPVGFVDEDYVAGAVLAYRAVVVGEAPVLPEIEDAMVRLDTDGDGQSDWVEWQAGTSIVEAEERFVMTALEFTDAVTLSWTGVKEGSYRLQVEESGAWTDLPGIYVGTGESMQVSLARPGGTGVFRVIVVPTDSDGDGLDDWEEHLLGLDPRHPKTVRQDATDLELVTTGLAEGGELVLEAFEATLLVDEGGEGAVRIRRTGGFAELEVPLVIGGDAVGGVDYESLPPTVTVPFGAEEVMIPVRLLPGSVPTSSKLVTIGLGTSLGYQLGEVTDRSVALLKENLVNVRDHGALGDGVTDDADALQAAIDAMEANPAFNGLYFPPGTYRVERRIGNPGTFRILELGLADLTDRDVVLRGAPGSRLYYDSGIYRAIILRCRAGFRSLSLRGMHFERSPDLLWATPNTMPVDATGVAVGPEDGRLVQQLSFKDCLFVNCNRSVRVSGFGYDIRGRLGVASFEECRFKNPYGSNTIDAPTAFGGGQGVNLRAWVAEGRYIKCLFEGGGEDMTDQSTSPGGIMLDGSHAGSPMRLVFRDNIVRWTAVEAVFLQNDVTFMGATTTAFEMPPADDVTEVAVFVDDRPSTYVPGEHIVIRTPLTPGVPGTNSIFTIRSFDPETRELRLTNTGLSGNAPPGTTFAKARTIFLDERPEPPVGIIENNFMDGTPPLGGNPSQEHSGIVYNGRTRVAGNFVRDYGRGVLSYVEGHTPLHPASAGSVVERNIIYTRDPTLYPGIFTYGIKVAGPEEIIRDNTVICHTSFRMVGIGVQGADARVSGNKVWTVEVSPNGYASENRSVGIASLNTARDLVATGNLTRGFDVGVGPATAYQAIPYQAVDHESVEDVLPLDPIGLGTP